MLEMFFEPVLLASTIRLSVPILLVALGGSFGSKAGVLNIGLESFMLISAFFSMLGSYMSGDPFVGLFFGIFSGLIASLIFGFFVLYLNSNAIIVGIALNSAAWGMTTFLLDTIFHVRGVFIHPNIKSFKTVKIPVIDEIPYIGQIISNHNIIVYFAFIMVAVLYFVMYKTTFGLRIRGVGIKSVAAQTLGVSSNRYKWFAIMIGGVLTGIGGAYLSIGGSSMFTENMSAGRGFLALACIMVANSNPLYVMLISLVFGYTSALSVALQSLGIPSQLVLTTPYVITILILIIYAVFERIKFNTNVVKRSSS